MLICPKWQATWRGVYPAFVGGSIFAPFLTSTAATLTLSSWAHKWRGVRPFWNETKKLFFLIFLIAISEEAVQNLYQLLKKIFRAAKI